MAGNLYDVDGRSMEYFSTALFPMGTWNREGSRQLILRNSDELQ